MLLASPRSIKMTQISPGNGACCLPSVDGVTYLKVGSRGVTVGMTGLDKLFQQLWSLTARPLWMMGHRPEQATDDELVGVGVGVGVCVAVAVGVSVGVGGTGVLVGVGVMVGVCVAVTVGVSVGVGGTGVSVGVGVGVGGCKAGDAFAEGHADCNG